MMKVMKVFIVFLVFYVNEIYCTEGKYCVINNYRVYDENSYVDTENPCERRYCSLGNDPFVRIMVCGSQGAPECRDPKQEGNRFPKCCTEKPWCTDKQLEKMRQKDAADKEKEVRQQLLNSR
uniref:Single domain-containing protein n=1 Tax=Amblyomma triste TaxID=251400 RepID=A0A023GC38_AMBTT